MGFVADALANGRRLRVVPEGSADDPSRAPAYYDPVFKLLASLGIPSLLPS